MLTLDLRRVLSEKGIENPNKFLLRNGFNQYNATRLLNNSYSNINLKYLEKICLALQCTLDDLFIWQPDKSISVPDNHPLMKLLPHPDKSLGEKLKQLPFEKIRQVSSFIDQLNNP